MHYPPVVLFFTLCFIFSEFYSVHRTSFKNTHFLLPLVRRTCECRHSLYFSFFWLHSNSYFLIWLLGCSGACLLTRLYSSLQPQATCFPTKPFKLLCAQSYSFYFMVSVSFPFITKIFALTTPATTKKKHPKLWKRTRICIIAVSRVHKNRKHNRNKSQSLWFKSKSKVVKYLPCMF